MLMTEIEADLNWSFYFDPREFVEMHGELKLDKYKLTQFNYRKYAKTVSQIRKRIIEKSEVIKAEDAVEKDEGSLTLVKES